MTAEDCRTCTVCGAEEPLSKFTRNRTKRGGYDSACRKCKSEYARRYYRKNSKAVRWYWLKRRYGVGLREYNDLLKKQGGVCAICEEPEKAITPNGAVFMLAVDHCHNSKRVRGLLCGNCNKALGCFKDRPLLIVRAASYLLADIESYSHETSRPAD